MHRAVLLTFLLCVFALSANIVGQSDNSETDIDPNAKPTLLDKLELEKLEYPSMERKDLVIPEKLWEVVKKNTGHADKALGYTEEEMLNFKSGTKFIIPVVERIFRDITKLPSYSGKISDLFLKYQGSAASASNLAYNMMGHGGGLSISAPPENSWGVDWLADEIKPVDAIAEILKHEQTKDFMGSIDKNSLENWQKLPVAVQKLAVRIIIAGFEAKPWLLEAFDKNLIEEALGKKYNEITADEIYAFVSHPWTNDAPNRKAFEVLESVDFAYLNRGSTIFYTLVQAAINEFKKSWEELSESGETQQIQFDQPILFNTAVGKLLITGVGNDEISTEAEFIIDLGGNDVYSARKAVPLTLGNPCTTLIDIAGNDKYDCKDKPAQFACGLMGVSAVFELGGEDSYTVKESGLGAAWFGSSVLYEYSGNDKYRTEGMWSQGSACTGVGMLIELAGNDEYFTYGQAQGFATTQGIGVLMDIAGNDDYSVSDTENMSAPFHDRAISFAQGAGFGRRADFGDGHSLAGGIGILVEGAGDDSYWGSVYAQGAGYWWAIGILEDRGGNDEYRWRQYSCGSAPHMAMGCVVDLMGDDVYNKQGQEVAYIQHHACARDGSFAVFIDGDGNDEYYTKNRSEGSAEINSMALFWDRNGDDVYHTDLTKWTTNTPPWGFAVPPPKKGSYRDKMATVGVFLDTGGKDTYNIDQRNIKGRLPEAAQNHIWLYERWQIAFGFGIDIELFKEKSDGIPKPEVD